MTNLRELKGFKITQIMANFLGHFNNFITLSLSLSLSLSAILIAGPPIFIIHAPVRGHV